LSTGVASSGLAGTAALTLAVPLRPKCVAAAMVNGAEVAPASNTVRIEVA
jgi:hypothetical protein